MSEEQKKADKIFYEKLKISEIFQRNSKVFQYFRADILLSILVFFIPLSVILSIFFQDAININLLKPDQKSIKDLMSLGFISRISYVFFFSSIVLYVKNFFEKKVFHKGIFFKSIFNRLFLFLMDFAIFYFLVFASFTVISVVIQSVAIPAIILIIIVLAIIALLRACFYFAYFLTFDENISGLLAFKESFNIFKTAPLRVLIFSTITFLVELAIPFLLNYLSTLLKWHRLEFRFLSIQICIAVLLIIPAMLFAVLYYNLRQITKPKDSNSEESKNTFSQV